jgi:hypothetical protein
LGIFDIDYLHFSYETLTPSQLHLTPLRYPQKFNYSQSNLIDEDLSEESLPLILHQKIKVDTNLSLSLNESTKFVVQSLVLKVIFIRKCYQESMQTKRIV